jgi:hypothetical protein
MKPTAEQIAEAAKRGIVPGAVCRSPYGTVWTVGDCKGWETQGLGSFCDGQSSAYIYHDVGGWATVITPASSAMEDRIAAAEASLQRLDDAIAALKAKIEGPVEAPQGLQAGDYCDASKEVADALTAMGLRIWGMGLDKKYYVWDGQDKDIVPLNSLYAADTHLHAHTFLARARVTAAKLGLKAPEPWTPKFGDRVMTPDGERVFLHRTGATNYPYRIAFEGGRIEHYHIDQLTPIKP